MGSRPATPHDNFWECLLPKTFVHPALHDDHYAAPWHGAPLAGTAIFTIVISAFIMCAKIYARFTVIKRLARDDWVIIIALVRAIFFSIAVAEVELKLTAGESAGSLLSRPKRGWCSGVGQPFPLCTIIVGGLTLMGAALRHSALGRHTYDSDKGQILAWFKVRIGRSMTNSIPQLTIPRQAQYIISIITPGALCLIRMSVLLFISHLDSAGDRSSQLRIMVIQVINVFWYPASILPQILVCVPHEMRVWDLRVMLEKRCLTYHRVEIIQRISMAMVLIGAVLDFMLLFLPVRLVWNLQHMSTKQKAIIMSLFALGFLSVHLLILPTGERRS